jgi:hypothetical protein
MSVEAVIDIGGSEVTGLAASGTNIWATQWLSGEEAEVVRIDSASNSVAERFALAGATGRIQSSDTALWISGVDEDSNVAVVRRDDASGVITPVAVPTTGEFQVRGDTVWVGVPLSAFDAGASSNEIAAVPISESTGEQSGQPISLGHTVFLPFAADDMGIWFIGGRGMATVNRLNLTTGLIDISLPVGQHHALSATLDPVSGSVWVADEERGVLVRVDVRRT